MGTAQAVTLPDNIGGGEYYASQDGSMVWDKKTGLVWARCSQGQSWDGKTCTGEAKDFEWEQALAEAKNFNTQGGLGGYKDWHVPSLAHLAGLRVCSRGFSTELEEGVAKACAAAKAGDAALVIPTIDSVAFPGHNEERYFWSSSPYVGNGNSAWRVGYWGNVDSSTRDNNSHIRLVRASQLSDIEAASVFTEKLPSARDTLLAAAAMAKEKFQAERQLTWLYQFALNYPDLQEALGWVVSALTVLTLPWIVFRKKLVVHRFLPAAWWSRGVQLLGVWNITVLLGGIAAYRASDEIFAPHRSYVDTLDPSLANFMFDVLLMGFPLLLLVWLVRLIVRRVQRKRAGNT